MKLILITLLAFGGSITCHAHISVELARNVDITQARLLADLTAVNGSYPEGSPCRIPLKTFEFTQT